MVNVSERQERWTYKDTIDSQRLMLAFVRKKIDGNPYFRDRKEAYEYFELLSNSILSQGPLSGIVPNVVLDGMVVPLGNDVHHFALQMMDVTTPRTKVKYKGKEWIMDSKVLWERLLHYLLILFPRAQTEALHMSSEKPKMREKSLGYVFSSDRGL